MISGVYMLNLLIVETICFLFNLYSFITNNLNTPEWIIYINCVMVIYYFSCLLERVLNYE